MDIRNYLTSYFQKPQINQLIISYITQRNLKYQTLTNDQLMNMLDDLQILQPLLEQINSTDIQNQKNNQFQTNFQENNHIDMQSYEYGYGNKSTISLNIKSGRKFKSFIKLSPKVKFYFSVVGFNQKSKTKHYSTNNNQSFMIGEVLKFVAYQNQLKTDNNYPLQLALVLVNIQTNQSQLYSVKLIEWRYLLCYGSASFEIELAPYYHEGTREMQAVGILAIQLKLSPVSKLNIVTEKAVQNQLQLQKKLKQKYNNEFYKLASDFWNDYKQIHRNFSLRRVKLYASSQDKILIPLCKLVTPLYSLKGIQSPNHALRFCSLIQFQTEQMNHNSYHKRYSSILANKKGSIDDHCNLLCGMLLGFGLKAYVAVGYSVNGEHSWVITTAKDNITFWQCTKGQKFDYFSPKTFKFYKSIHVLYNHIQYYSNIQLDDSISGTKFNLPDKNLWKSFSSQILSQISPYNRQLALLPPSLDVYNIESGIENGLKIKIADYRKKKKISGVTNFDNVMNSILTTALTNYEWQRISGTTFCEQQFQTAIKGYIPVNHTFKAFPIQLTTLNVDEIMQQLIGQVKCKEIMLSKGDSLFFGLRCKVVAMPDNVFAVWVSLAVRYFKLQN